MRDYTRDNGLSNASSKERLPVFALIAAAGQGSRMGIAGGKQLLEISGKTVISRTCAAFEDSPEVDYYLVLTSPEDQERMAKELSPYLRASKLVGILNGGESRQESVWRGLSWLADLREQVANGLAVSQYKSSPDFVSNINSSDIELELKRSLTSDDTENKTRLIVLVQDGARCLVDRETIRQAVDICLEGAWGAAPAITATDTIRILDQQGEVSLTPERSLVRQMQTPQGADFDALYQAYRQVREEKAQISDDLMALEYAGYSVKLFPGKRDNIKLTRPEDLLLAEYYLGFKTGCK
ncbi:MAG: 2-C-methyl-D-erythritol 4-phosphate cytidylyltransferase [Eubacteriales bacterium]|nr:2-C-methyl-D-erythritol 4-phosphate cytidylyltransferase [Eubacteriales bacterium]